MKTDAEVCFYEMWILCYSQHWFELVRFDIIKMTLIMYTYLKDKQYWTVIKHKTSFIRSQQMDWF